MSARTCEPPDLLDRFTERDHLAERICEALDIADTCGQIEGDHHRAWVIDQMVRELLDTHYHQWLGKRAERGDDWDVGIAP